MLNSTLQGDRTSVSRLKGSLMGQEGNFVTLFWLTFSILKAGRHYNEMFPRKKDTKNIG